MPRQCAPMYLSLSSQQSIICPLWKEGRKEVDFNRRGPIKEQAGPVSTYTTSNIEVPSHGFHEKYNLGLVDKSPIQKIGKSGTASKINSSFQRVDLCPQDPTSGRKVHTIRHSQFAPGTARVGVGRIIPARDLMSHPQQWTRVAADVSVFARPVAKIPGDDRRIAARYSAVRQDIWPDASRGTVRSLAIPTTSDRTWSPEAFALLVVHCRGEEGFLPWVRHRWLSKGPDFRGRVQFKESKDSQTGPHSF
ncbi:hypothetical protein C8F04DRAFT_1241464 [Mycena alexandri]|uniref:Uncharacterized protein n=1 Tax=Mycena alexandri TaxID=1745969 RepID=A0AAD6WNN8_9AGAR|nr:hypothetical protein C8F04DRAFT_1241464 [Mycena alexandri]